MKLCQACGLSLDGQELEDTEVCASCIDSEETTTSVRKSILNFWKSRIEVERKDVDSQTHTASE